MTSTPLTDAGLTTRCRLRDTPTGYGIVSRVLHWTTAALVLFQFTVVLSWRALGETSLTLTLSTLGPHGSLGVLLLAISVLRAGWAFFNRHRRPPAKNALARIVHLTLYGLLITLPSLAILRQYGRGGALRVYGQPLFEAAERDIPWMVTLANALHSPLSWLLLVLVLGHAAMALIHRLGLKDDTLSRMAGPLHRR